MFFINWIVGERQVKHVDKTMKRFVLKVNLIKFRYKMRF